MKKMIIVLITFFAFSATTLNAQLTDVVNFTANLASAYLITVQDGNNQVADFLTAADYNNGVFEGAGITSGISTVTMEATGNWNVQIRAADFENAGATEFIPIGNLGCWLVATGAHQFGTEVLCPHIDAATTYSLTNGDYTIIDLGPDPSGNGGDATDNEFEFHWRMGTPEIATIMGGTMFDQLAAGDFIAPETYQTVVNLTLTPIP